MYYASVSAVIHAISCYIGLRRIVGVNNKTSVDALYSEFGKYPIYIDIIGRMLDYENRLTLSDPGKLIFHAYLENKSLADKGKPSWVSCIKHFKNQLNFNNTGTQPSGVIIKKAVQSMQERFETQWKNRLFNDKRNNPKVHNKLRTFRTLKYTFKHEPYIDQISNLTDRRNFCRLRISAHNLNIELGRHTGVDLERRVCNKCNLNSLEDELHAFMYCPAHDPQRQILFHYISTNYKIFHQLDGEQQFIWLMSNEDIKVMSRVTKFVTTILQPNEWPCPGHRHLQVSTFSWPWLWKMHCFTFSVMLCVLFSW